MKIVCQEDTLRVTEVEQLTAAEALSFREAILAVLGPEIRHVEIELSHTERFDCGGLGALIALRKRLGHHQGGATLSLRNPARAVQRLLQITRTELLFASPPPAYEASPHF
jgi:anti-anti-sigma factor